MQCPVSRETQWLLLALVLLAGCPEAPTATPGAPAADEPAPAVADVAPTGPTRELLLALGDARQMGPELRAGLAAPDPETRRVSARVAARFRTAAAVPLLQLALSDVDRRVRAWAALGLSRTPHVPPVQQVQQLSAALSAEQDSGARAVLIEDLGHVLADGNSPIIQQAFGAGGAQPRAACRALSWLARRGLTAPPQLLMRVAQHAASAEDPATRLDCAHVYVQLNPVVLSETQRKAAATHLMKLLSDPDPELRIMALRALAGFGSLPAIDWDRVLDDDDYRVVAEGFRSLAALSLGHNGATFAELAEERLEAIVERPSQLSGTQLQVLLAIFEAGGPLLDAPHVENWSQTTMPRLRIVDTDSPRVAGARALAHCAAAKLADLVRKWPGKVERCGHKRVPDYMRDLLKVQVLAVKEGADEARAGLYRRLYDGGDPHVKQAVMRIASTVPIHFATPLFLVGLADADGAVVTAALESLSNDPGKYVKPDLKLPPGLAGAIVAAFEPVSHQPRGLRAWLSAVRALDHRGALRQVQGLAGHGVTGIRQDAQDLLREWGQPQPAVDPPTPTNALAAAEFPPSGAKYSVQLQTSAGTLVLELDTELAPASAQRFVELATSGYFDKQPIHADVPGATVASGDPRGLGFDGPAWTLRHEDSRKPFVRGTVGLRDHGRDSAGAHFFITLRAEPSLAGRYTVLGRVASGMDVVDMLRLGDRIERVQVVARKPPAAP